MQAHGFPPHVFAAAIERDLVLFDTAADRYVALPGALRDRSDEGVDVALFDALLAPEAKDALVNAGLLLSTASVEPVRRPIPKPSRILPIAPDPHRGSGASDITRVAVAVVQTRKRLARGLPCGNFSRVRRHQPIVSMTELVHAIERLHQARLLIPHPRRCLPASIVSALFLRGLGQPVEIIFGVRSHPFEAHCWIEADGIVLDDDLDRVRAFTPIAAALL